MKGTWTKVELTEGKRRAKSAALAKVLPQMHSAADGRPTRINRSFLAESRDTGGYAPKAK